MIVALILASSALAGYEAVTRLRTRSTSLT